MPIREECRLPNATYRLQLRPGFGFDEVCALLGYFVELGISHLYLSPYLQAAEGSTHGYDVVDHGLVNQELGGEEAHARLCAALRDAGLGQIIDVVPNHMSIASRRNRWWWDVLENGPLSRYARHFDVDWDMAREQRHNQVLLPILEDHYGRVLEAGGIRLVRQGTELWLEAAGRQLPLAPHSLPLVLARAAAHGGSPELGFFADVLASLPASTDSARLRHLEVTRRLLARLIQEEPPVARALDWAVDQLNAHPDELDRFIGQQNYRLAYWRAARHDLDYRRFFDINELAALRTSDRRVFEDTHALILEWVRQGEVEGLRIDHPDGLEDPQQYLEWLREASRNVWIVAEKVLEPDETLPESWPVDGTTGYDFMFHASSLFVDPAAEPAFTEFYGELGEDGTRDFRELARELKRFILDQTLASDLSRLTRQLHELCGSYRRHRDHSWRDLQRALVAVLSHLPVYRTYRRRGSPVSERDRRYLEAALEGARHEEAELEGPLELVAGLLTGHLQGEAEWQFVARFQQLSGAVMAKAVEDTAYYRYHRLICLNEVGGDPARFGVRPADFHALASHHASAWPATLLSTSTHDSKRSEDTRLRIAILSQFPDRWREAVVRWTARAQSYGAACELDGPTRYLLWQTLVGTWPIDRDRLTAYLCKAVREAKVHTSWTRIDEGYEASAMGLCRRLLEDGEFTADLDRFVAELLPWVRQASLSLTLLKLTAPGVPDVYQGTELWDHSLADPDNRRPVDFAERQRLLTELKTLAVADLLQRASEGLPKLYVLTRALAVRRAHPAAFGRSGSYRPLELVGPAAERAVGFVRGEAVLTLVPTLPVGADFVRTSVAFPAGRWRSALASTETLSGIVPLERVFGSFPVGLWEREEEG